MKSSALKEQISVLADIVGKCEGVFKLMKKPKKVDNGRKLDIVGTTKLFNLYVSLLITALVHQLDLQRHLSPKLTTKEL